MRTGRGVLVPTPEMTAGVKEPVMSLNGLWKFTLEPPVEFYRDIVDTSQWVEVPVPGEPWMQGLEIRRDVEYPYKKMISIPADFAAGVSGCGLTGCIASDGCGVNGVYAGEHYGGFTRWHLDITELVTPGQPATITVGVTDLTDDLSFASGYASRMLGEDFDHFIAGSCEM